MKPKRVSNEKGIDLSLVYPSFYVCQAIVTGHKPYYLPNVTNASNFDYIAGKGRHVLQQDRLYEDALEEIEETVLWLAPMLCDYLALACSGEMRHGARRESVIKLGILQEWGHIISPFKGPKPPEKPKDPFVYPPPDVCDDPDCEDCKANQELYEKEKAKAKDLLDNFEKHVAEWEDKMDAWHKAASVPKKGFDYEKFMKKLNSPSETVDDRADAQDLAPLSDSPMRQETFLRAAHRCFKLGGWESGYGGPSWAQIAWTGYLYRCGKLGPQEFVDAVAQLRHNGGVVFDKRIRLLYFQSEASNVMPLLDMKRDARNIHDLCRRLRQSWPRWSEDPRLRKWCARAEKWCDINYSQFTAELALGKWKGAKQPKVNWLTDDLPEVPVVEEGLQPQRNAS